MRLFVAVLLIGIAAAEDCGWTRNTDSTDIPEPIKKQWYKCIFESVENRSTEAFKSKNSAILNGLKIEDLQKDGWTPLQLAPRGRKVTKVEIHKTELRKVYPKENTKELDLEGYFHMCWKDPRLAWDKTDWRLSEIKPAAISKTRKMWFPILDVIDETGKGVTQASELILPVIQYDGQVNASMYLDWQAKCKYNFDSYPNDVAECETVFEDTWSELGNVELCVENTKVTKYVHYDDRYGWEFVTGSISEKKVGKKYHLTFKITVKRTLVGYQVQTVLPIVLATVLAMLAPLFGPYHWQAFIKVIALVLQYMAVADFVSNNWSVRYSSIEPSILKFFEFTMILTMISLIITLILYCVSRRPPELPPPHGLTLFADKTTGLCHCASTPQDGDDKSATVENGAGAEQSKGTSLLWEGVLNAFNNVIFLFFFALYLIGMFVFLAA